ncbi:hypothetical protein TGDOM2_268220 [Toxoplasma gondii GAB2-2007-GAL-DOM2]|uniref:Uncharacterized protein n=3 Tax=Toxoplasma gondii TaxID=5811 RepID=A0A086LDA6_TOXGO|nr:hypothetical protein TGDOM2_268220 [Toxoplasma gondii GAB2-2007-GAL-DOM2]KFG54624.1 hypothetical protein TGFOU_268220 [Toxoplasma gondii FOU]RQX75033.1 hypothetical protein TGCAST_268220 [Toxoplasma gondii CAST]
MRLPPCFSLSSGSSCSPSSRSSYPSSRRALSFAESRPLPSSQNWRPQARVAKQFPFPTTAERREMTNEKMDHRKWLEQRPRQLTEAADRAQEEDRNSKDERETPCPGHCSNQGKVCTSASVHVPDSASLHSCCSSIHHPPEDVPPRLPGDKELPLLIRMTDSLSSRLSPSSETSVAPPVCSPLSRACALSFASSPSASCAATSASPSSLSPSTLSFASLSPLQPCQSGPLYHAPPLRRSRGSDVGSDVLSGSSVDSQWTQSRPCSLQVSALSCSTGSPYRCFSLPALSPVAHPQKASFATPPPKMSGASSAQREAFSPLAAVSSSAFLKPRERGRAPPPAPRELRVGAYHLVPSSPEVPSEARLCLPDGLSSKDKHARYARPTVLRHSAQFQAVSPSASVPSCSHTTSLSSPENAELPRTDKRAHPEKPFGFCSIAVSECLTSSIASDESLHMTATVAKNPHLPPTPFTPSPPPPLPPEFSASPSSVFAPSSSSSSLPASECPSLAASSFPLRSTSLSISAPYSSSPSWSASGASSPPATALRVSNPVSPSLSFPPSVVVDQGGYSEPSCTLGASAASPASCGDQDAALHALEPSVACQQREETRYEARPDSPRLPPVRHVRFCEGREEWLLSETASVNSIIALSDDGPSSVALLPSSLDASSPSHPVSYDERLSSGLLFFPSPASSPLPSSSSPPPSSSFASSGGSLTSADAFSLHAPAPGSLPAFSPWHACLLPPFETAEGKAAPPGLSRSSHGVWRDRGRHRGTRFEAASESCLLLDSSSSEGKPAEQPRPERESGKNMDQNGDEKRRGETDTKTRRSDVSSERQTEFETRETAETATEREGRREQDTLFPGKGEDHGDDARLDGRARSGRTDAGGETPEVSNQNKQAESPPVPHSNFLDASHPSPLPSDSSQAVYLEQGTRLDGDVSESLSALIPGVSSSSSAVVCPSLSVSSPSLSWSSPCSSSSLPFSESSTKDGLGEAPSAPKIPSASRPKSASSHRPPESETGETVSAALTGSEDRATGARQREGGEQEQRTAWADRDSKTNHGRLELAVGRRDIAQTEKRGRKTALAREMAQQPHRVKGDAGGPAWSLDRARETEKFSWKPAKNMASINMERENSDAAVLDGSRSRLPPSAQASADCPISSGSRLEATRRKPLAPGSAEMPYSSAGFSSAVFSSAVFSSAVSSPVAFPSCTSFSSFSPSFTSASASSSPFSFACASSPFCPSSAVRASSAETAGQRLRTVRPCPERGGRLVTVRGPDGKTRRQSLHVPPSLTAQPTKSCFRHRSPRSRSASRGPSWAAPRVPHFSFPHFSFLSASSTLSPCSLPCSPSSSSHASSCSPSCSSCSSSPCFARLLRRSLLRRTGLRERPDKREGGGEKTGRKESFGKATSPAPSPFQSLLCNSGARLSLEERNAGQADALPSLHWMSSRRFFAPFSRRASRGAWRLGQGETEKSGDRGRRRTAKKQEGEIVERKRGRKQASERGAEGERDEETERGSWRRMFPTVFTAEPALLCSASCGRSCASAPPSSRIRGDAREMCEGTCSRTLVSPRRAKGVFDLAALDEDAEAPPGQAGASSLQWKAADPRRGETSGDSEEAGTKQRAERDSPPPAGQKDRARGRGKDERRGIRGETSEKRTDKTPEQGERRGQGEEEREGQSGKEEREEGEVEDATRREMRSPNSGMGKNSETGFLSPLFHERGRRRHTIAVVPFFGGRASSGTSTSLASFPSFASPLSSSSLPADFGWPSFVLKKPPSSRFHQSREEPRREEPATVRGESEETRRHPSLHLMSLMSLVSLSEPRPAQEGESQASSVGLSPSSPAVHFFDLATPHGAPD